MIVLVAGVLAIGACGPGDRSSSVSLPPTPVVTLRPTWAVVADPYVRLRAEPAMDAPISGHLRRGDVARIDAIGTVVEQLDDERSYWYRLETGSIAGWVLDGALEAYGSEYRARNAAERLREDG